MAAGLPATEVTNSMSNVASSIGAYRSEQNLWPPACSDAAAVQTTLGVALPAGVLGTSPARLQDMSTDALGVITVGTLVPTTTTAQDEKATKFVTQRVQVL